MLKMLGKQGGGYNLHPPRACLERSHSKQAVWLTDGTIFQGKTSIPPKKSILYHIIHNESAFPKIISGTQNL